MAFGLGLLASDPKCFEQSDDKTVLKGDCKGSEVLVVKSRELKVHFKSTGLPESEQNFEFTFGGHKIGGVYGSFNAKAIVSFGGSPYNLPLTMTVMPDDILVKKDDNQRTLHGSSKFEENGNTYKIAVDYAPMNPEKLGSLTITFDATIFVEKEDITAKIILAVIAALVILVAVIIVVVVIYCCCAHNKKSKKTDSTSAIDTSCHLVFIGTESTTSLRLSSATDR
ncbi:hypothetical protein M3Y94_01032000 [Aphelenchoides besseyi]|nr:hypothetical protein M3Y94_01032000 [Aphelenchoides besseyi]